MEGSVEGLLFARPRADRGGENADVVTCCSIASSNFISAAVLDSNERLLMLLLFLAFNV